MTRSALAFLVLAGFALSSASAETLSIQGGRVEGSEFRNLSVFKGIRYAQPPVGSLRWRAPQPVQAWRGVRKAVGYGPACPQIGNYPAGAAQEATSEDCLTLNIWTPAAKSSARLPVMVWIHGGGLVNGSGSVPQYAGDKLAARGVVVVTINYRLGALGFLAHPELNRESRHGGSGNYGLLDQIAALKWVKQNISAFGGNPERVTIFGQSSGSFSVSMLVASPLAKGLFKRAIGQSGGVFEPVELDPGFTPKGAAEAGARFADRAGAKSLAELRKLPVEALLKARFNPQFNVDGYVIPAAPYDAYRSNAQNQVDLLVGSNATEGTFFFDPKSVTVRNFDTILGQTYPSILLRAIGASPGRTDREARKAAVAIDTDLRFRWDMWTWARQAASKHHGNVYLYRFTGQPAYRPDHPLHGLGPTHGGELAFVFGQLDQRAAEWTAEDRSLSEQMQRYWVNFARSGNPNGNGLPNWPAFNSEQSKLMELGQPLRVTRVTDETRLKRISRVYGAARFVNHHLYAVIATAGLLVLMVLIFLFRLFWRLKTRKSRRTGNSCVELAAYGLP